MEWRRVLWKKQPFADNYVGDSFLRVCKRCREVTYTEALYAATAVTQEICSCLGLVAVFFGLSEGQVKASVLLSLTAVLSVLGYLVAGTHFSLSAKDDVKLVCFYLVLISCASPLVKSLTGSVATDTINACTTGLLLLRLIHQDYGATVAIVNPTVSHNLGVFASICLASRLESNEDVFALMTLAVALFTLFPGFRQHCRMEFGKGWDLLMTFTLVFVTFVELLVYASHLLSVFLLALIICNIVVPVLFVYLQSHKQNIYGPWDEAQIEDR